MNEATLLQTAKDLAKDLVDTKIQTADLSPLLRGHLMRLVTAYRQSAPATPAAPQGQPRLPAAPQDPVDRFLDDIDEVLEIAPWASDTLEGIKANVKSRRSFTERQENSVNNIREAAERGSDREGD